MKEPCTKSVAIKTLVLYMKKTDFEPMTYYSNLWNFMYANDQATKIEQDLKILPFEDEKFYQLKVNKAVQWFKGNEAGYW